MSADNDVFDKDNNKSPGGWVKQDPDEDEMGDLVEYISHEVGLLDSVLDMEEMSKLAPRGEQWEWQDFQLEYIDETENYICNKPRQVGMSAAMSAKAFARGILNDNRNYTAVFTSYNQDEAINKVNYVKDFLRALPPRFRKEIVRDPLQLIEWKNSDGTKSKIISHPQRPIRGVHGDIFLDELGFYQYDDEIYESAMGATGATGGTIDIVSTPFGKKGKFYEIISNPQSYQDFVRKKISWWHSDRYLKNTSPKFKVFAEKVASQFDETDPEEIEARIHKLGNQNILKMFRNTPDLASFRQEFEGYFVDQQASFMSREMILSIMFPQGELDIDADYSPNETDFDRPIEEVFEDQSWPIVEKYSGYNLKTYEQDNDPSSINRLYDAVQNGHVSGRLVAGVDLATKQHATEFVVLEEIELASGQTVQVERFNISKQGWQIREQASYFKKVLRDGVIRNLNMDVTNLGTQMAEDFDEHFRDRFNGIHMGGSGKKKHMYMNNLRNRMEEDGLAIGYDRQKIQDLHSIKRKRTQSGNFRYITPEKNGRHCDYAWALAFGSLAGTAFGKEPIEFSEEDFGGYTLTDENELKQTDDMNVPRTFDPTRDMDGGEINEAFKGEGGLGGFDDHGDLSDFNKDYEA